MSSSDDDGQRASSTPTNDYLWRFNRRRLDAEAIRDTLLAVGGNLDRTPGGPHPFPPQPTWDFTQHNPFKAVYETNRRSVYLMTQRIQRHPFLALFDGADPNASTDRAHHQHDAAAGAVPDERPVRPRAGRAVRRASASRSGKDDAARIERAYSAAVRLARRLPKKHAAATNTWRTRRAKLQRAGITRSKQPRWESLALVRRAS